MEPINTDVYALKFLVKGTKLCFVVEDEMGKQKRHWTDMSERMAKAIKKEIDLHLEEQAIDAALTPAQLAEKYMEFGGS